MRLKWPFRKHCAPKMRLVEVQCAHRKHCYPETPLGSHPTSRVSQLWHSALLWRLPRADVIFLGFTRTKGPFRTKNTTALESVVFCCRRTFSLSVPFSCLFSLENKHFSALSVAFCCLRSDFTPRTDFTLRSSFSTAGPFGELSSSKKGSYCRNCWGRSRKTLRAKGTLISEPRFSTPCEMRFSPREKGKTAFFKEKPSTKAVFPFLAWEKSQLAGGRKSGLTN